MPWHHSPTVLRLLALLALSELVRTGLFFAYLPLEGAQIGLTAAGVGLIVSLHYLADGLAKGPLGVVTERLGLGWMALLGALGGTVALLALPRFPSVYLGWLMSVAWGFTLAPLWPGVMTAVSTLAREGKQSRALSWASVAAATGIALGALGMSLVMQRAPHAGYALLLGVQVVVLALALSLVRLKLPRSRGSARAYPWRRIAALIPAAFAQTLAPGLLVTVFNPYLRLLGLSITSLLPPAILGVALGLAALPLAGRLADKVHPRAALLPGLLLLGVTFVLLGLPGVVGRIYLIATVGGCAYALFLAGWNGLVARTLPQEHRAAAWGAIMTVEALGQAVGPALGGFMWERYGSGGPFLLGAGVFVLVQAYYLLPWHSAQRRLITTSTEVEGAFPSTSGDRREWEQR